MCLMKLHTKPVFRIFHILKINIIMSFCNLLIERPSYLDIVLTVLCGSLDDQLPSRMIASNTCPVMSIACKLSLCQVECVMPCPIWSAYLPSALCSPVYYRADWSWWWKAPYVSDESSLHDCHGVR